MTISQRKTRFLPDAVTSLNKTIGYKMLRVYVTPSAKKMLRVSSAERCNSAIIRLISSLLNSLSPFIFLSNVERLIFVRLQNSPMVSPCSTILPLRTFLFTFATSIDAFVGYVIVQPIVKDTACPGKSQAHMAKNFALLRNL